MLPFANLSADKEQEYFSDGLAEEIISLLAQVPGLKVIARTSSFAFRGRDEDVRSIARALDVTHVLEGSVRRAGERIRVTAQLIAAVDGGHVWSERFDRELSDIFAVQDEIAAAMTAALRVKLSAAAAPQRYAPAFAAYDAYLKAKHHEARVSPASMELAKSCYESAIALDPAFALAHVGVGSYWLGKAFFGGCPTREAMTAARAASRRALQIDEWLPEAHALLGTLRHSTISIGMRPNGTSAFRWRSRSAFPCCGRSMAACSSSADASIGPLRLPGRPSKRIRSRCGRG